MMHRRNFMATAATAAVSGSLAFGTGTVFAQANPKVARIVVPFAAGGVQDLLARAMSTELGVALGQTVIIDNRPGAGGTVGTGFVAKAAPDSNTMVLAAASHKHRRHALHQTGLRPAKKTLPPWPTSAPPTMC